MGGHPEVRVGTQRAGGAAGSMAARGTAGSPCRLSPRRRSGPFHIGVPYIGWGHRHRPLYMRANPNDAVRDAAQKRPTKRGGGASLSKPRALVDFPEYILADLCGALALQLPGDLHHRVSKRLPDQSAQLCQPSDDAKATVDRLRQEIAPSRIKSRFAKARRRGRRGLRLSGKILPSAIPTEPVARMQLMQSQLEELAMAVTSFASRCRISPNR